MATKKLRVRHKKRTYRQRRSQRRVVGGGWREDLAAAQEKAEAAAAAAAAAAREKAKQVAEAAAVRFIKLQKTDYRQLVIDKLQYKLDELNKKQTNNIPLTNIEAKIQKFLSNLIEIIQNNKSEAESVPVPVTAGGRSKRTTRKIQKGGFGALLTMLLTSEGRNKIMTELNNDPEMFNMVLGIVSGIFGENSLLSKFIREYLIRPVPQQSQ